jgi:hypothetical protein
MSYRIFEQSNEEPLKIFGCVVDCSTLMQAEEVEEDITYTLLRFTDVEVDKLEIWKVDAEGNKVKRCN